MEKLKFEKFRMSTVGRVRPGSMRGTPASQQKIAERLTILNERAPGMMTRLYNLKNQVWLIPYDRLDVPIQDFFLTISSAK